ncbi:MAG: hypothetical protein LBU32_16685, partial [Clostridiales bacterium]|nr:hypothetical protein [Clostridiales bacterium]
HIDSACGRVHAQMYKAAGPLKTAAFDTAKGLFPEKANFNERCKTCPFRESALGFAANAAYSQTMDCISRHAADVEKFSSTHYFHNLAQNEGDSLAEAMDGLVGSGKRRRTGIRQAPISGISRIRWQLYRAERRNRQKFR